MTELEDDEPTTRGLKIPDMNIDGPYSSIK